MTALATTPYKSEAPSHCVEIGSADGAGKHESAHSGEDDSAVRVAAFDQKVPLQGDMPHKVEAVPSHEAPQWSDGRAETQADEKKLIADYFA